MGYLLKKAANREWKHSKRQKCVSFNTAEKNWIVEENFGIRHGDAKFGVCQLVFCLALFQYVLTVLPSLCFGIVCISRDSISWKIVICILILILQVITVKRLHESQKTL